VHAEREAGCIQAPVRSKPCNGLVLYFAGQ